MDLTVVVCTWNRAHLLARTLDELVGLDQPPDAEWELLIVNNNSSDHTEEVVGRYARRLPIRLVNETRQGHSHARNAAIKAARGDLLLWTDDDCLVDPGWLTAYHSASKHYAEAAFFGGPIDPFFEIPPPSWLEENIEQMRGPLALSRPRPADRPIAQGECPIGANMAIRRRFLEKNPFDPSLGHREDGLVGGDETELMERLTRQGLKGMWVAKARLRHLIPQSKMTKAYAWQWYVAKGIASARLDSALCARRIFGVPRWLLKVYMQSRLLAFLYSGWNQYRAFAEFCRAAESLGAMREYRTRSQSGPQSVSA